MTFESWLKSTIEENPNLTLLAKQIEEFDEIKFQSWIEDGIARIVLNGNSPLGSFHPGKLIVGASISKNWREEILAAIALTPEITRNRATRGIVNAFQGIAPAVQANDVLSKNGRNNECLTIELLKTVREMRAPLYSREATPLDALRRLLTVQFPSSSAVFSETIVTWRAFSHQIPQAEIKIWIATIEEHKCFSDEYALFIAFGLASADQANAHFYLFEWAPVLRYRRSLANEGSNSPRIREKLSKLTDIAYRFLAKSKRSGQLSEEDRQRIQQGDATTTLLWESDLGSYAPQIYAAENYGRSFDLSLANLRSHRTHPLIPFQTYTSMDELGVTT